MHHRVVRQGADAELEQEAVVLEEAVLVEDGVTKSRLVKESERR